MAFRWFEPLRTGMPTLPPFRLMYNHDTTNVGGCVSPWRSADEPFDEARLVASIEEAAAAGADCVTLAPGLGWIPWWKSRVDPDHYGWWTHRTGLDADQYGRYLLGGGDMIAAHLATCRRLGIACLVSLRLNDVHLQEHYGESGDRSIWVSRFYLAHLDCLIDPQHKSVEGYYGRRGLDWARAEVRAYKLALAREMVGYDVDGIELDCLRDSNLFAETVPTAERIRCLTEFAAGVRSALDEGRRGRWLSMRIPVDPAAHAAIGIDVARLRAAGVDIFICSGWYDTTQRTDGIAHVRAQAPDAAAYLELTHTAGYHRYFLPGPAYGTSGNPRCADAQLYSTARLALLAGAHGISLFNFVYYRSQPTCEPPDAITCEPPFHTLRRLTDRAFLERQPGHYHLGTTSYFRQLPVTLPGGGAGALDMEIGPHPRATAARLRLHTRTPLGEDQALALRVNGTEAAPTTAIHRHFGNPFDALISPPGHRRAFDVPLHALRAGLNHLEVRSLGAQPVDLIYVDLGVSLPPGSARP